MIVSTFPAACLVLCEELSRKRSHIEFKSITRRLYATLMLCFCSLNCKLMVKRLTYIRCITLTLYDALNYHNVTAEHLSQGRIQVSSGALMACLKSLASYNLSTTSGKSDMPSLLHRLCLAQAELMRPATGSRSCRA